MLCSLVWLEDAARLQVMEGGVRRGRGYWGGPEFLGSKQIWKKYNLRMK